MNTWKVILATMVIFGAGVVTGGLLVRNLAANNPAAPAPHTAPVTPSPQPGSPGGVRMEFLRRVQRDLDLTPDQRQRIDHILKESQERTKKLMEPVAPLLHEEVQRTKEEFRAALTPEQRTRFDELVKQQQRPKEPRRPGPPREHPEGPPPVNPGTATNL